MSADSGKNSSLRPDLLSEACLVIHSSDIFYGNHRLVLIRHNDDWYKLMITKQNKLILMK